MEDKQKIIARAVQLVDYIIDISKNSNYTPFETYIAFGTAFLRLHLMMGLSRKKFRLLYADLLKANDWFTVQQEITPENWSEPETEGKQPVPFPQEWKEPCLKGKRLLRRRLASKIARKED